ncbi:hypothetical protein HXX76_005593 [Chlamydomonas incerta]|uniref:Uncharacterized protein n=1 Tax=Chlamydomonas incerta TaxID=51695 RepID=A0A835T359_CHLIN|nr:hypothetical protein HXX76_005593 [Chlamydomonas incerta]|eukprot:KAG2437979.1 hypothetical protein HXX76_005593 [Chlamydomonas incerta]
MSLPVHAPDDGEVSDYQALRKKVQTLKGEHRTAIQEQQTHRGVDISTLASRCQQLEAVNAALNAEVQQLREESRKNTERASKYRKQTEREQQKLRDEVERLTSAVANVDEGWAAKLSASETTACIRVKELEEQIEKLGQDKETALAAQREEHEASLQDIDEWCRGEIEAVQHNARVQAVSAHEAVEQWQRKYDDVKTAYRDLELERSRLSRQLEEANGRLWEREAEVQQAKEAIMRLNVQHASAATAWQKEKRALEQLHAEQMEAKREQHTQALAHIEERLQQVVAKKDSTIASLRAELQKTYSTLLPLKSM